MAGPTGIVLLLTGLVKTWSVARAGVDFPSMYVMGMGIVTGTNIYEPSLTATFPARYGVVQPAGMFYPPATGFTMLPFALFPYGTAKTLWFLVMAAALVFGVRALVKVGAPGSAAHVWTISTGIVLLSAAVRWGMLLLQGAPLVLGLLCLFVAALHGDRPRLALLIAAVATALKMTLALPFLGLLALHRRFGALAASMGAWVLLNALGFLRMGGGAFAMYRQSMASLESLGSVNAPDPWSNPALPRLDWTFLFYGLTHQLALSRIACLALSGAVSLWLLSEGFRAQSPPTPATSTAFVAVLVCLGSLSVYHHEYDACLFLAPALLGYFVWQRARPPLWALLLATPLTLVVLLLPLGKMREFFSERWGTLGVGLVKLSFPTAFTLALVGSIGILRWNATSRAPRAPHAPPAPPVPTPATATEAHELAKSLKV